MEEAEERRRICREKSPERGKACVKPRVMRPTFKKLQIVYYLSRNGHLEHPHYMELTHLAHQHLRLKDVIDKLTVLRGKAMPSLYSWSCKRSYKNGYVWNDLTENDVIYPSEGAEYVLKGSELMMEDKLQQQQQNLQLGPLSSALQSPNLQPKHASKRHEEFVNRNCQQHRGITEQRENVDEDDDDEYEEDNPPIVEAFKRTPGAHKINCPSSELTLPNGGGGGGAASLSPPSATSSTGSEKNGGRPGGGEQVGVEPLLSRNSMLLSLIACGGSASFRKAAPPPTTPPRRSGCGVDLRREAVRRAAATEDETAAMMIGCMSENPRFGGVTVEEKEYYSGSIVEAMANVRVEAEAAGGLKKSASHNQERSTMAGLEGAANEELDNDKCLIGKCIPMKKSSSKHPKK
ncbi:Protein UPSTREAM OF FLC [Striga hermonthica]|uniref:Protein UPSTREAM OF FLC n=1 Tax=Striga hermonthica TaxID=68872 RepID=A0A9N7RPL1_STRHE|nr:Protein UPSTREAM OF FLC [Striga hermonthica]